MKHQRKGETFYFHISINLWKEDNSGKIYYLARKTVRSIPKEAEAYAKDIAKNQGAELIIQGRDGKIRSKDSFGNDPNPPKDTEH